MCQRDDFHIQGVSRKERNELSESASRSDELLESRLDQNGSVERLDGLKVLESLADNLDVRFERVFGRHVLRIKIVFDRKVTCRKVRTGLRCFKLTQEDLVRKIIKTERTYGKFQKSMETRSEKAVFENIGEGERKFS